jgi:hypothetical protein
MAVVVADNVHRQVLELLVALRERALDGDEAVEREGAKASYLLEQLGMAERLVDGGRGGWEA